MDGFLTGKRFLLLDRDPLYTSQFRALLSSAGVTPIRLPPSSPNLNAYAERFVRSILRRPRATTGAGFPNKAL